MDEERIRVPAPAGSLSQQEIVRVVFTSMAGRRLLPKECWSLSSLLHDTVAPTIRVHLVADSINAATLHRLLEDTSRRNIQRLTLDGDFTSMQQRPLSLPPSLERLELNGFRGELGEAPSGPLALSLCASRDTIGEENIPHPLLTDIDNDDAVQHFLQETAQIVEAMLPTLRSLRLCGLSQLDSEEYFHVRACVQALWGLPHPHLEYFGLLNWALWWADLVPLLSPAVAQVDVAFCSFLGSIEDVLTIPSLPEGVASLSVTAGFTRDVVWAFSKLPQSLRHLTVDATTDVIVFEQPLPTLLESFIVESGGEVHVDAGSLPASLRNLQLWGFQQLYELPPRLRVLMLQRYIYPLPLLPDTLETLVLDYCTHHVSNPPDSVRSLALYWHPPQPAPLLPARWPAHLERLVYWAVGESEPDDAPEPCIDRHLPPTLTQLELNGCSIATDLPQTLQKMRLGRGFSQELDFTGSFKVTVNGRMYLL